MKIMVPSCAVRELYRLTQEEEEEEEEDGEIVNLADLHMDCLWGTLSILVGRIALLEYSKMHEKAYKFIVCEFGGFQNVLRAYIESLPTL